MSYAEDILKLRARVAEAINLGALDGTKETLEAVLIQIMNDAERNRQTTIAQAENLRKQAATLDGQAAAFSSMISIIYNVINGYIRIAERANESDKRSEEEQAQKAEAIALEKEAEKKDTKKPMKPGKNKDF